MTPRTFFTIFLKILGIYLVVESLTMIPQFISTFFYMTSESTWESIVFVSLMLLIIVGIYALILRYFIFKTGWIIDKLALDKNFAEEKIEINVHRSTVLSIAIAVIGGLVFIDAFPMFCKQVFIYFQERRLTERYGEKPSNGWLIFYAVKAFVGCCLMIYQQVIVNFIELQRKKKT